jgi:hypothetical protein
MVSFMSRLFYSQEKCPWYSLDRRLGGPQRWYGHSGEEKNSHPLLGIEPLIVQHYTTELSWLLILHLYVNKFIIKAN